MKKNKKTTLFAVLFVFLAIVASQVYGSRKPKDSEGEMISVVSVPDPAPTVQPLPVESIPPAAAQASSVFSSPAPLEDVADITKAAEETPAVSDVSYAPPSDGTVSVPFSDKELIFFPALSEWRCHMGIDYMPGENDCVCAAADGTVESVYEDPVFGTTVVLSHAYGIKSSYASLREATVAAGETVTSGDTIGYMGEAPAESGVHLHFAAEKNGISFDPFVKSE